MKWHKRFMCMAVEVGSWSKDPNTKVGAVVINPSNKKVVSVGFNGFPRKIADTIERLNDRKTKNLYTMHAERNALDQAEQSVEGHEMFVTMFPCHECCKSIIQRGISKIYTVLPTQEQLNRWQESMDIGASMLKEADVSVEFIETPNQKEPNK